jgi:hypothetical protein
MGETMEEVLHYLQLKNQYYEKFLTISQRFLEQANQNKWDELEFFVDNRERILNIIRSYDFKVARAFQKAEIKGDTEYYGKRVRELLDKRTQLASKIVALDLELITKIDEIKSETVRELKRTVETQHQIDSFEKNSSLRTPKPPKEA